MYPQVKHGSSIFLNLENPFVPFTFTARGAGSTHLSLHFDPSDAWTGYGTNWFLFNIFHQPNSIQS